MCINNNIGNISYLTTPSLSVSNRSYVIGGVSRDPRLSKSSQILADPARTSAHEPVANQVSPITNGHALCIQICLHMASLARGLCSWINTEYIHIFRLLESDKFISNSVFYSHSSFTNELELF